MRTERAPVAVLAEQLLQPAALLHDVPLARSKVRVDHVVVASNGVWLIDTTSLRGRVELRTFGRGLLARNDLYEDGVRRRDVLEAMEQRRAAAARRLPPGVMIWCALVFDGDEDGRAFEAGGVVCGTPTAVVECINVPGALDWLGIERLATRLGRAGVRSA